MSKKAKREITAIQENNRSMRAKASPKMQVVMDQVQDAIDSENSLMDARFEAESKLRKWAEDVCGVALDMTEIEMLNAELKVIKNGDLYTFRPKRSGSSVILYKTAFGTVDRLDKYIYTLEKAIVDLSDKLRMSEIETEHKDLFTEVSFFGLIKLAFSRLLKRSK